MSEVRLSDVMTSDPVTSRATDPLSDAADAMRRRGVGSTVVMEDGAVVGILTERDLIRAVADGADPTTVTVDAWMTRDVRVVTPGVVITQAIEQMLDRRFRHMPVVDADKLVGIVSLRQLVEAARIRKVDPWSPGTGRGLENVTVAETELSYIDGQAGKLIYRGYEAVDLARNASFEDAWHLLYYGELPRWDTEEAAAFGRRTFEGRALPLDLDTMRNLARSHGTFMGTLQAAAAATGAAWGLKPWLNSEPETVHHAALRLGAVMPTLVCALWRLEQGLDVIDPDPSLGHAANYLFMMHGRRPDREQEIAISRYLVLTMDHGLNASTFTGRVIASTGADVGSAVAGAIGALSGPLHGGAPSLVADMLDEIGSADRAAEWVERALASGQRLMGFGHRVYKTEDPRAACLRDTGDELGAERAELAKLVEQAALEGLRRKNPAYANTNVEFYSAVVLERAGVPRQLFTPSFAVSRTVGWTAHILEQVRDNRLIRPTADYVGPMDKKVSGG